MDELIRTFERRMLAAEGGMNRFEPDSASWHIYRVIAATLRDCILDAKEAKRRMADREPAWNPQP